VLLLSPVSTVLARPIGEITATVASDEAHATWVVSASVVPSLKWPVAVNCTLAPAATSVAAGATMMDVSVALLTCKVDVPTKPAKTAVIVACPGVKPVATP